MGAVINSQLPKVLVTSLPKSGTNVLESTLARFPGMREAKRLGLNSRMRYHPLNLLAVHDRERCLVGLTRPQSVRLSAVKYSLSRVGAGQYALSHLPYQRRLRSVISGLGISPVFVIRDPRDVVVSFMHHALNRKGHFLHKHLQALRTDKDRFIAIVVGGETASGQVFLGMREQLDLVSGWIEDEGTLTVRFEEIIGPMGSGSIKDQVRVMLSIGRHIGIPIDSDEANAIGRTMFGKGSTFRKGQGGAWRDAFDEDVHDVFTEHVGEQAKALGY